MRNQRENRAKSRLVHPQKRESLLTKLSRLNEDHAERTKRDKKNHIWWHEYSKIDNRLADPCSWESTGDGIPTYHERQMKNEIRTYSPCEIA